MPRLDPEALVRHLDTLHRAAWALCGSREDAEDLVQETYALLLARPRMIKVENERAYLLQALRNTFLTMRRTASRRPQRAAAFEDVVTPDSRISSRPEQAAEVHEVFAAIAAIADDFRLALIAVDIVGLSYREAGLALGVGEATIATRLFRAREQVASALLEVRASNRSPQ